MKKQYTTNEIMDAIKNYDLSFDTDNAGSWGYYLHHDGEKFVSHCGDEIQTFFEPAPYIDALSAQCTDNHPDDEDAASDEFWNQVYDLESADNEDFKAVVEGMTDQVNSWLAEKEDD